MKTLGIFFFVLSTTFQCLPIGIVAAQKTQEISLEDTIDDIVPAGGGRFLLIQMNRARKLTVFDSKDSKIIGTIPLSSDRVSIAGTRSKAVLLDWKNGVVARWDIESQKKELVQSVEFSTKLGVALSGSATNGPLLVAESKSEYSSALFEMDLETLATRPVSIKNNSSLLVHRDAVMSANGSLVVCGKRNTGKYVQSIYREGDEWKTKYTYEAGGAITVHHQGKNVLSQAGPLSRLLVKENQKKTEYNPRMPILAAATDAPFYLGHPVVLKNPNRRTGSAPEQSDSTCSISLFGIDKPLGTVEGAGAIEFDYRLRSQQLPLGKRVWFVANLGKVISVNKDFDGLRVTTFDLKKILAQSKTEFLAVLSQPKAEIKAGNAFEYKIDVLTNSKNPKFNLDFGPEGMKVSDNGVITWKTSTSSDPKNQVIIAISNDKGEKSYHSFQLAVSGANGILPSVADFKPKASQLRTPDVSPSRFEGDQFEMPLPSTFSEIRVGGAGRYLCLLMPTLNRIAVVDVVDVKVSGYVPAAGSKTVFTAGREKLVVFDSEKNTVRRYNLTDQLLEQVVESPFQGDVSYAAMGSNAAGPILLRWSDNDYHRGKCNFTFLDVDTLQEIPFAWKGQPPVHEENGDKHEIRASADGTKFTIGSIGPVIFDGKTAAIKDLHGSPPLLPSASGNHIGSDKVYGLNMTLEIRNPDSKRRIIPAVNGDYYLTFVSASRFTYSKEKPLLISPEIRRFDSDEVISMGPTLHLSGGWAIDKELFFIPNSKSIVKSSRLKNSLVFHRVDPELDLAKSKQPFLYVSSTPRLSLNAGETFEYQIQAQSSSKSVTFSLTSGPSEMKLGADGKISWITNKDSAPENIVIVSITDDQGQQAFHTFKIRVKGGSGSFVDLSKKNANGLASTPKVERCRLKEKTRIPMPSRFDRIKVGGGGRFLCVHLKEIRKIAIFDTCLAKTIGYVDTPGNDIVFSAGNKKLIVINVDKNTISRWNLANQKRELTKVFPFEGRADYAAMGCDSNGPLLVRFSPADGSSCFFNLIDTQTLNKSPLKTGSFRQNHVSKSDRSELRASSDGSVFVIGRSFGIRINGSSVSRIPVGDRTELIPSADGRFLMGDKVYDSTKMAPITTIQHEHLIPATRGSYYLSPVWDRKKSPLRSSPRVPAKYALLLLLQGETRPLAKLDTVVLGSHLPMDQNLFLIPDAGIVVFANEIRDSLSILPIDTDEVLEKSGVDYFLVSSQPNSQLKLKERFEYDVVVKSKSGGVKFKLDDAPKGMTITESGRISWNVPHDLETAEHNVIVSIRNANDQEIFHTFSLSVPEAKERAIRLAREKRKTDQMNRMKRNAVVYLLQFKARAAAAKAKSELPVEPSKYANNPMPNRIWKDKSGLHEVESKFVRIEDKQTVVIIDKKGVERKLQLNQLSSEDLFYAVETAIRNLANPPKAQMAKKLPAKLVHEVYLSLDEMVGSYRDKKSEEWLESIFHPTDYATIKSNSGFQRNDKDLMKVEIYTKILTLECEKGKLDGDLFYVRGLRLRRSGKRWLISN